MKNAIKTSSSRFIFPVTLASASATATASSAVAAAVLCALLLPLCGSFWANRKSALKCCILLEHNSTVTDSSLKPFFAQHDDDGIV